MKASSDNNDFRGWGWLGSLETGLPFSITDNLMLEPQLQYTWQGLSLDDGQDNAGYVKFGHGSAQHVRAGFRLGSHNDMNFGKGTSSRDTLRGSAKHSVRELPVNWWVQPSVIRTFSSRGDMSMGNRAEMSPEAAGIAACLMTYSHHACRTENYAMTVHYYRLRDYALQHPECSAIMRIID